MGNFHRAFVHRPIGIDDKGAWRFNSRMKVVTIATDLDNPFLRRLLIPSCAAVGLELNILHPATPSFSFSDKRVMLTKYLSGVAEPDELIVFTDAYDALFVRGEADLESAYACLAKRVVFSAELNSWPLGVVGLVLDPDPPAGPYPYLNSGGFVGPAGDLLDLCVRYPDPPSARFEVLGHLRAHGYDVDRRFGWSDQYHWTLVRLLEPDTIGLDHRARLFECYGPPIPDVVLAEAVREARDFQERGAAAPNYQRERSRLRARLRQPSEAVHIHFSSAITKAVALDLLDEGELPGWLTGVLRAPARAGADRVRVHHI